ncbi:T9SS type B sorting domain-containing protein [Flavobacterium nitratireducens]|uniref:T9SS type B sorting domain-containing protein n=1 Tax=Flavobacterium nitratireducens TaxID=992289 RepID=UPI0024158DF8|nr:T9SS type B sorting domain-containing protein [Flavobacterium nitratireducens]
MKKILIVFFFCAMLKGYGQFSKTHYIPPLTCQDQGLKAGDHYLYISTPTTKNVEIKIIAIGGQIINATINKNNPYVFPIGVGEDTQLFVPKIKTGQNSNKGYIIEADDLVYCSVRVNAGLNQNNGYNHAGGLVTKGNSALGTIFRLGAMTNPLFDSSLLNFASILATDNNTTVTISNIPAGTVLANGTIVTGPITINLNKNESYIIALENNQNETSQTSNSSKIIGALVTSNKAIVVNSGSFGGSNSIVVRDFGDGVLRPTGRDIGFDQIVPIEKTGKEYIFVKGVGPDEIERVIIVAHEPQTSIYLNDKTVPSYTLQAGEYIAIDGSEFIKGNLYVRSSENVFAYQCIGGLKQNPPPYNNENLQNNPIANQNLFYVPPINCATPNIVDNIPMIESIGNTLYNGGLNIITEKNATVSINNNPINSDPVEVTGNPNFVVYTIANLNGNITIKSTKQVYVSYFGTNNAATYGGYYSGFDSKPEIAFDKINITTSSCIPNIILDVNSTLNYDSYQWYFNDTPISNSNSNTYKPTEPGYYQVRGSITGCNTTLISDIIPVSNCTTDVDNDTVNDNIDLDHDNDGISNCNESYGNQNLNISNISSGNLNIGSYSNSYTGTTSTSTTASYIPITGNSDGSFISDIPAGKGNFEKYTLTFNKSISIGIEYVTSANITDLLNANAEYTITTDTDKTITVLNPNNELLIDTNYDGIYESGVTEYSSFEIRFQINGITPLTAGSTSFKFLTHLINSISFIHKNLLDTQANRVTMKFFAICVPKDSDGDGIVDQLDTDTDNDGVTDLIESQANNFVLNTNDANKNGIYDVFETQLTPIDTDADRIPDYLDLDSDNDGILDSVETGSNGTDTDNDGIKNFRDLDSDGDLCDDVTEAGFTSTNRNPILGTIFPATVDNNGLVTSRNDGYTTPNSNYLTSGLITITNQPEIIPICLNQNASVSITSNAERIQWQITTDGTNWNDLSNNSTYSGVDSNTLNISTVKQSMNGYKYRVFLNKLGNSCGLLSEETSLTVLDLPIVKDINIKQCDDDLDSRSSFNLTVKNNEISANYENETFDYFTSNLAAETNNPLEKITNPLAYEADNGSVIWTRVTNNNGCYAVAKINLLVSASQLPPTYNLTFENCDDYIDATNDDYDKITAFDFSSASNSILTLLPEPKTNYSIKYYSSEADALAEINEITNTTSYRNSLSPKEQKIWVRVDNEIDNSCFGVGPHVTLIVNPKPDIDINTNHLADVYVCNNLPNYFVTIDAGILDGSLPTIYNYVWVKDNQVLHNENKATLSVNKAGTYTVTVSSQKGYSRTRTITVMPSEIAKISEIKHTELSENNSIIVLVEGSGNYEYSLDDNTNFYQESNRFENVSAGIHQVYIRDKNGCGVAEQSVAILGIPKFFTPNNDGYNDYWTIKGINSTFNSKTVINIFNRYGKLIKNINPQSQGWDGTINGQPLPTDDYWFTVKLENGKQIKGHFSLKR